MADVLCDAGAINLARKQLTFAADVLRYFRRQLKSGDLEIALDKIGRVTMLDALCDEIATNNSKFRDEVKPIFNGQRWVVKGRRYQSANLTP